MHKKTSLYKIIFEYFKIPLEENDEYCISTQEYFKIENTTVIPDITIKNSKNVYLVEVKVDSRFNRYFFNNEEINQVELYAKIENAKIITLTKSFSSISSLKLTSCYWYGIYEIFSKYDGIDKVENYLANQFCMYLEDYGMSGKKVSNKVEGFSNIINILDESLKVLYDKFGAEDVHQIKYFFEPDKEAMGFYFTYKEKKGFFCLYASEANKIYFSYDDRYSTNEREIELIDDFYDMSLLEQLNYIKNRT